MGINQGGIRKMKKKWKDITEEEQNDVCDLHKGKCDECPFNVLKCCWKETAENEELEKEIEL